MSNIYKVSIADTPDRYVDAKSNVDAYVHVAKDYIQVDLLGAAELRAAVKAGVKVETTAKVEAEAKAAADKAAAEAAAAAGGQS